MMTLLPEGGLWALCLAVALTTVGSLLSWILESPRFNHPAPQGQQMLAFLQRTTHVTTGCVLLAFGILVVSFVQSDFSVRTVAMNSHLAKPLLYKISGVWSNHEGSMMLWLVILAVCGSAFARTGGGSLVFQRWTLLTQQLLTGAFLWFVVLTSHPFTRLCPVPLNGLGLNPLLEDPSLAIHPPLLYGGYVGYSLLFSLAIGALRAQENMTTLVSLVRRWGFVSWTLLTFGIALGSWWAYYTLGWGGWWFWDPVETVSLLPWLLGTMLLHALRLPHLEAYRSTVVWLLMAPFCCSVLGTILVRSGWVMSVHAFAKDPERGAYLLLIWTLMMGYGLQAWWRSLPSPSPASWFNLSTWRQDGGLRVQLLGFGLVFLVVMIGTLVPLIQGLMGAQPLVIEPLYYDLTLAPIGLGLAILMGILPWGTQELSTTAWSPLSRWGTVVLATALWVCWSHPPALVLPALGYSVGLWTVGSTLSLIRRKKSLSMILSHLGVGVFILGVTGQMVGKAKTGQYIEVGQGLTLAGYDVTLRGVESQSNPLTQRHIAWLDVYKKGQRVTTLQPERRFYPLRDQETVTTAIYHSAAGDLYTALGAQTPDGRWGIQLYYNPLMGLLWLGCALLGLGGFFGLRRGRGSRSRHLGRAPIRKKRTR